MITILQRLILPLFLASCVPGNYTRDFVREATAQAKPPSSVEGAWVGEWKSEVNGHHGPLWCIVRPSADRPGHYDFRYRAGWAMVRFGDYTHTTEAEIGDDGRMELEGEMELPAGLGTYGVEGVLTPESFEARYRSEADRGTMRLARP